MMLGWFYWWTLLRLSSSTQVYSEYIDLFYGTRGGGHMFPGSSLPFGMCKMGVDLINSKAGDAFAGYQPDGEVNGISMLHESGTGGSPTYGIVSQLPFTTVSDIGQEWAFNRTSPDISTIGYYKTSLNNGVTAEFSANERSGLLKYTFPCNLGETPGVLVNLTHHLHSWGRPWWSQNFEGGFIKVQKDLKGYSGKLYISGGWSSPKTYAVNFEGRFDVAAESVTAFNGVKSVNGLRYIMSKRKNKNTGVYFEFPNDTQVLHSHVGISFAQFAGSNIDTDYGPDNYFDLEWSVQNSIQKWNNEVFSKFKIDIDYDPTRSSKFYTALYGAHLMPTNKTGEQAFKKHNKHFEPYYDDWFTIWDTFRCLLPMYNVFNHGRAKEMVRSLVDMWRNEGFMPDGRSGMRPGRTQGGSNADIVVADAFVKNIISHKDPFWEDAYSALLADAERIPPYVRDPQAPDSTNKFGRGGLKDWINLGFVSDDFSRSVTRTMEYSYNDFAISAVALGLGKLDDYDKYTVRSSQWQNIWNPKATTPKYNYTGFIQPRKSNGEFRETKYDPLSCGGCYWRDDEYEGSPIEYGWAVPHDIKTLRGLIGDDATFIQRLDDMFGLYGDSLADIGNEPSFLTPYLYNYVNAQYRTSETIHYITKEKYKLGEGGLPGNSDAGSLQAWLWWGLVGIYPVAGTTTYLISGPQFPFFQMEHTEGTFLTIYASNLSDTNMYIKNVTKDGILWNQNWFTHNELFTSNTSLEFYMTDTPTAWDSEGSEPPSPGHFIFPNGPAEGLI